MTGDGLVECLQNGDWLSVLTETQFGHAWLFRVAIDFVIGTTIWLANRNSKRTLSLLRILATLSLIELVTLAWTGHAVATRGAFGIVHLLGDAVHLLAAAFWPGSLVPLATFLTMLLRSNPTEGIVLAVPIVRRFSASSLIAVAVLASTGLLNAIFMSGTLQALLASPYGRILVFKIILFSAMIGFGAWNLLILKPKLAVELPNAKPAPKSAIQVLIRNVFLEIGLGTFVILIVALLGITPPPMN